MADNTLTIVIPTYNECDNIKPLVERLHKALNGSKYEILFVDDNSRDGTAEAASAMAPAYPVRVIVRKNERGLASAVVHGFKNSTAPVICVMDADLQHPPEVVAGLLEAIEKGADVAIGSRYVKGGGCEGWSLTRRIISKGAIFLSHLLLPRTKGINDPMSGLFMLKRPVIEGAALQPTGYKILLEILIAGRFEKVAEVPYGFKVREKGESKLSSKTQIDYLKHLRSLMERTGEVNRLARFTMVGLGGAAVTLVAYWLLTRYASPNSYLGLLIAFEANVIFKGVLDQALAVWGRRGGKGSPFAAQFVRFNIISLGGLGILEGSLWLFNGVAGLNDLIAVVIGIIIATPLNYLLNSWFMWK